LYRYTPGAEFIVCGSEDEHVYVWSTINSFVPSINPIYTGYRQGWIPLFTTLLSCINARFN
jgi:hypothetical protein